MHLLFHKLRVQSMQPVDRKVLHLASPFASSSFASTGGAVTFDFFHTASIELAIHAMIRPGTGSQPERTFLAHGSGPDVYLAHTVDPSQFVTVSDFAAPDEIPTQSVTLDQFQSQESSRYGSDAVASHFEALRQHFLPFVSDFDAILERLGLPQAFIGLGHEAEIETSTDPTFASRADEMRLLSELCSQALNHDSYRQHLHSKWFNHLPHKPIFLSIH